MEYKDYYKILGVERNADEKEIKKAYRRLARQFGNAWMYTLNFEKVTEPRPGVLDVVACPDCHADLFYHADQASLFCAACQHP